MKGDGTCDDGLLISIGGHVIDGVGPRDEKLAIVGKVAL